MILDEIGATDDPALLRLRAATDRARAKLIMVGDWRQLGPVGPGGAFEALLRRHKGAVTVLSDNVRQLDAAEGRTLHALRSGSVAEAVGLVRGAGTAAYRRDPDRRCPVRRRGCVAADVAAASDTMLMAWRRTNVADLNARARQSMADAGRRSGPELAVGSRRYEAGDRVVTLAPAAGGELVTSTRAVVRAVDTAAGALTVETDDGRSAVPAGADLAPDRLDLGYATTVIAPRAPPAAGPTCWPTAGARSLPTWG